MQGREVPGHVGEVLDEAARPGQIPVRQAGKDAVGFQQIPCGDVAVDDPAAAGCRGSWLDLPDGAGWGHEVGRDVMQFT
jgi:hypothetical protein